MKAIAVVVLALLVSSLAGCAGGKGEYYRLTTRTTQDGCCPPFIEKEEVYAIGDPRVAGSQAPVLDRGYAATSGTVGSDAAAENAATLSDFFGGGSSAGSGSVRLHGPEREFYPIRVQGVQGYRYTPRNQRKK